MDLAGPVDADPAVEQRAELVESELEGRGDPEVRTGTPKPPEEIGLLGLARSDRPAVRGDDLDRAKVIDRQADTSSQTKLGIVDCDVHPYTKSPADLDQFLPETLGNPLERRAALASTLLAGLEMARGGAVRLRQETAFGPILVRRGPGGVEEGA